MSLIVRKYGGSSVSDIQKIKKIAQSIKQLYESGNKVVLVISAMGKTTNELLNLAQAISNKPDLRELDMLLSIGERKSISLMSLALNAIGVPSISFTGSQIGIITDNNHGNAKILDIRPFRLKNALTENKVVVVAGYQGVSEEKEITTLGRGGTDTTAIALSSVLKADYCQLMKDVDGLMDLPPKYFKMSELRRSVSLDELYDLAIAGTELVALPAIKYALKNSIEFQIGNASNNQIGTSVYISNDQNVGIPLQISIVDCDLVESNKNARLCFKQNKNHYFIHFESDKTEKNYKLISLFNIEAHKINSLVKKISSIQPIFIDQRGQKIQCLIKSENFIENLDDISRFIETT